MPKRNRARPAELERRIQRARALLDQGIDRAEVSKMLADEYGVSIRTARRYISPKEERNPKYESREQWRRDYVKRRYRDSQDSYRALAIMRSTINVRIKRYRVKKAGGTLDLVGCTIDELCDHLESLFEPGMTWENWSRHGWHVDHIRPCSSFDLNDPEQQRLCFHYTNLQPLWAHENREKHDKWDG